jgi:hypothetical protein
MAENTENQEVVNESVEEGVGLAGEAKASTVNTTVEYSDTEKKAMAQGWVPEDQYEGTGKWRSAEEFLDRGELFAKIDEQNRATKRLKVLFMNSRSTTSKCVRLSTNVL